MLSIYFLTPVPGGSPKLRNIVLLAGSLVFYAWGEPIYVLLLIIQCVFAWSLGLFIDRFRGRSASRTVMIASVVISLSALVFFKYSDFFITNINSLVHSNIRVLGLALPIGISFYTFQILSYTIDLYRGKIQVTRSLPDFSAYVVMFPQLIAGPIVRYSHVERELSKREYKLERVAAGVRRFTIGLGKKVLIANVLGELVDVYKLSGDNSVLFTWLYIFAFALHIYFDFSGYSDMAIGMGYILGFKFPDNFNYPYIAKSITEFWRRWHMSLSSWFRDYVYIPLGGGRVSMPRHTFNIIFVWFLTGFWHGADWNFIIWGLYFAALLIAEKYFLSKLLNRLPLPFRHGYVLLMVCLSWVFFDNSNLTLVGATIARMFGIGADGLAGMASLYYLRSYLLPVVIGIVGCTPLPKHLANRVSDKTAFTVLEPLIIGLLLILITAYLADGSFNPFIYFRF